LRLQHQGCPGSAAWRDFRPPKSAPAYGRSPRASHGQEGARVIESVRCELKLAGQQGGRKPQLAARAGRGASGPNHQVS